MKLFVLDFLIVFFQQLGLSKDSHSVNASTSSTSIDFEECLSNLNTPSLADDGMGPEKNVDYWNFKIEMYVREQPLLYYNPVETGYKCKYSELFPTMISLEKKLSNHSLIILTIFWRPKNIHISTKNQWKNKKVIM